MKHKFPLFLLFLCVLFVGKSFSIVRTEEISDCTRDTVNEYLKKYKLTCSEVLLDNTLIKKVRECKDAACTSARLWGNKMDDVFTSLKPVVKENIKNVKSDTETFIENAKENAKIAHESAHDMYGNLKENAKIAQENAYDMYGNLKENAKIAQENAHDMYGNLKENAKVAHDSASDILENIKEKAHVAHDGASNIFGSIKENVKTAQENANDAMENVKEQLQQLKKQGQWTSDKAKQILDKAHHEALSQKLITEKEWKKAYASLESLYKPVPWYQRFFRAKPTPAEQINAKIDAFSQTLSHHIRHLGSLTKEQSQTITDQIRDSIDNADFEKLTDNEWVDSLTDILEKNTRFNKKDLKSSIDSLKSNYYEFKNDKLKYASSVLKDGMDYTGQAVKEGLDTASQVAKEGADFAGDIAKEHYEELNKAAKEKFEEAKQEAKKKYDAANQAAKEGYDSASQAAKHNLYSAEHEIKHKVKSSTFVDDVKTDWNNFWLGIKQKIFAIDDLFRRGWPLYHNDPQKTAQDKYRSAKNIVQSATQNWEDAAKTVADDLRDDWDASTQAAREGIYDQLHTVTETASHHQRKWGKVKDDAERKWKESKHAAEDHFHHQWNDAKEQAANLHDKWDKAKDHHASKIHHKWDEAKDHASHLHHKWDDSMQEAQEHIHQWGNSHHQSKNLYNQHIDTTPDVLLDEDILPSDYADHIQTVYPIDAKPLNEVSPKQYPVDSSFASFWKEKEAAIYNKLGYTDTHIDWIKTYLERTFGNKKSPVCGKIDEAAIVIKRYLDNIKIETPCEIEKTVDILKSHLESWRTTCYYN